MLFLTYRIPITSEFSHPGIPCVVISLSYGWYNAFKNVLTEVFVLAGGGKKFGIVPVII